MSIRRWQPANRPARGNFREQRRCIGQHIGIMCSFATRLVELGADIDASTTLWWRTPLAWGADAGSRDAVEFLLSRGANVNQDVYGGMTALHAVAQGGSANPRGDPEAYRRTTEILIRHGADINRRAMGDRGQTPLADAVRVENEVVAQILESHGAAAQ